MSAVAGILHLDGRPVDPEEVGAMTAALAHRGPDGAGRWVGGAVGLGHRLLHTTPESLHERQPLRSRDGDLVLVADARLDNRDELASALRLRPSPGAGATRPDGAFILAAYEAWGEGCLERLVGDFAFALWDGRLRRLLCARDPMGVKPLFFYHAPGRTFAFGTEIKALLALGEVPRTLDEGRVAQFLFVVPEDPDRTIYEHVRHVPAAHALTVGDGLTVGGGGVRRRRYWRLDAERELRLPSDEAYAEAFRAHLVEAVRCRLRSAFPVGSTLSGGLDSSSIACVARDLLREQGRAPLHTFSAVFPSLPEEELRRIDERPYVADVVGGGGITAHYLRADEASPLGDLPHQFWHGDEPYWVPNLYLHWGMWRLASERGARVLLDGVDGDSAVSHGMGYLTELAFRGQWLRFAEEAGALNERYGYRPHHLLHRYGYPGLAMLVKKRRWLDFGSSVRRLRNAYDVPIQDVARQALKALIPSNLLESWRRLRGRGKGTGGMPLITPDFHQRVSTSGRHILGEDLWSHRASHAAGLMTPLYPNTLSFVDRYAAAFHIEPRYPFFDRRLLEFSVALPPEQKLTAGWTRIVMRRAMEGILPASIQWRPDKANLGSNFRRNLISCEAARIRWIIEGGVPQLEAYVNLKSLRALYQRGVSGVATDEDYNALYTAIILGSWLARDKALASPMPSPGI